MYEIPDSYSEKIVNRSTRHFILGALARVRRYITFVLSRRIAQKKGAIVGEGACFFKGFAKQVGPKIKIGNHVSINTSCRLSSSRYNLSIGNNVIIGSNVNIILGSHNIDSAQWEHVRKNDGLEIDDYVWICPHSIILPSCKKIGRGAVIGAGSVVASDVEPMAIVGGNPAIELRKRKTVHSDLCVESLLGGDLKLYLACKRKSTNSKKKQ